MIYDCFNFFNELDILDLRLNTLNDVVDYFVIVESNVTHSGSNKPYYFWDNQHIFEKFLHKIINFHVEDTPNDFINLPLSDDVVVNEIYSFIANQTNRFDRNNQPDYGRDFFQKESVRRPLQNCSDSDIIMISDADEIPNPKLLKDMSWYNPDQIYALNQTTYYYYLNVLKEKNWYGTKLSSYGTLKNLSFNEVRGDLSLSEELPDGGWHFSFMGGKDMVKTKLLNYSARDMVNDKVLDSLEHNITNNVDLFFRVGLLQTVEIDDSYPKYLVQNKDKYKHLIK
jgi:beta-1,4-mannosyl-glycoprotein beta-1,4-N-acetylglucosaminyltransferase